ncbi:hypothetical protein cypCar_00006551 [Cyprinus carpio]|nr:hypothetical protein cypCar_00006551 [Cyprinus carpio]
MSVGYILLDEEVRLCGTTGVVGLLRGAHVYVAGWRGIQVMMVKRRFNQWSDMKPQHQEEEGLRIKRIEVGWSDQMTKPYICGRRSTTHLNLTREDT